MNLAVKMYWHIAGMHVHIRMFIGAVGTTLGKAGDLCMTVEEFEAYRSATTNSNFSFIEETL